MIIDCIADLHGEQPVLEGGDLLILGGDYTARDSITYWTYFFRWLGQQKYRKKIMIGGNHDNFLVNFNASVEARKCGVNDFEYLCDSGTEFEYEEDVEEEHKFKGMISCKVKKKCKIWGSPWTKRFEGKNPQCKEFTCDTEEELAEKWAKIPDDLDILITHSPPYGIFDRTKRNENVGSVSLLKKVYVVDPKLHVFGHVHEGYSPYPSKVYSKAATQVVQTKFVNCSYVNGDYEPINKPVRIIL